MSKTIYRNALERDTLEIPAGKAGRSGNEEGIVCAAERANKKKRDTVLKRNLEWILTIRTTVAFCDERIEVFCRKKSDTGRAAKAQLR